MIKTRKLSSLSREEMKNTCHHYFHRKSPCTCTGCPLLVKKWHCYWGMLEQREVLVKQLRFDELDKLDKLIKDNENNKVKECDIYPMY